MIFEYLRNIEDINVVSIPDSIKFNDSLCNSFKNIITPVVPSPDVRN